ncbi:MAG: hypothetical protein ACQESR_28335, partial [Planctomycetota bacterium]
GDYEGAWAASRRAGKHGVFCWGVAVDCLERHEATRDAARAFSDAIQGREQDKYGRLAKAFIVHDSADGVKEVRSLVEELTNDKNAIVRMFALCALCLGGDWNEVQQLARQSPRHVDWGLERFANKSCLDFLAGRLSQEKLLENVRLNKNQNGYAAINAHFTIAMSRFALRDRGGALKHLEECGAITAVDNLSYEMARAFLRRMKSDPTWPRWLDTHVAY